MRLRQSLDVLMVRGGQELLRLPPLCLALIHEREWPGSAHITDPHVRKGEACIVDESVDLSVQMASSRDRLPERHEAVLPARHNCIGRFAMLHKQQRAAGLE